MRNPFKQDSPPAAPVDADERPDAGRAQVLSKLFEEHNRALHSFLMMHTRNEQEAHEVAQEAYVRVLQLHQPGAISFLRAYLFKTAANIAVDRARQRQARERLDRRDAEADPIDRLNPERTAMAREDLALLEQVLNELPPKYRYAFVRHRFDEIGTDDIARELKINPRMARNYISRTAIYCKLRLEGLTPAKAKAEVMP